MALNATKFIEENTQILSPSIIPEVRLHLATEITPLWKMTESALEAADLPPPYWAFAWPGGQGVARYVLNHPELVKGKRIVDFASGSGVAAIAAMKAGAKSAVAIDIDPFAVKAIELNASLNEVEVIAQQSLDMNAPAAKADVIFAGDVCYQQAMSIAILRWLNLCVDAGKTVLLADPGRAYAPKEGLLMLASYDVPTLNDLEDKPLRTATIWRMEKAQA